MFVLNNLAATAKYLRAETEAEIKAARFVDLNMNRLPQDFMTWGDWTMYEINRARELYPIWQEFDVGFDVHTTTQDSKPMIISPYSVQSDLFRDFPFDVIISNIGEVCIGKPAGYFYGHSDKTPWLAIEAGSHYKPESTMRAITCLRALLNNLRMTQNQGGLLTSGREYQLYEVVDSVILPDQSYEMAKVFDDFEEIRAGQILAIGGGMNIVAEADGHTLLGPHQIRPFSYKEEAVFISKPVRTVKV